MDTGSAWSAYAPVRNLLESQFCFRQTAAVKLQCSPGLGHARLKAHVTKGYPAVLASSYRFRLSQAAYGFQGKLASTGRLKLHANFNPEKEPLEVNFSVEKLLGPGEDWGKYILSCVYTNPYVTVSTGLSSNPSLLVSLLTPKKHLQLATDVEVNLRTLELKQYHATVTWQGSRSFLSAMHHSTAAHPLGNLYFGQFWSLSDQLTIGGQLQYLSASNSFVSTIGMELCLGKNTIKAKLDSEGFVACSATVALGSCRVTVSTHFDAKNMQRAGSYGTQFGCLLSINP